MQPRPPERQQWPFVSGDAGEVFRKDLVKAKAAISPNMEAWAAWDCPSCWLFCA
jgi:hypothetical protein